MLHLLLVLAEFFDTVASLLGICYQINYEGQAAIELEKNSL